MILNQLTHKFFWMYVDARDLDEQCINISQSLQNRVKNVDLFFRHSFTIWRTSHKHTKKYLLHKEVEPLKNSRIKGWAQFIIYFW